MGNRRVDLMAVIGSVLALVMLVAYVMIIRRQDGDVAEWVVVVLLVGAAAAAYGAVRAVPYRRTSLLVAGVLLASLGMLAILSIGLPILVAGALCLLAAERGGAADRAGQSSPLPLP